jgi:ABC-type multidrug transport system fused ATPase/permease subunit
MSPKAKALIARLLPFGVCAFFILLFIQGISLITPFVMQRIIDRYIPAKDMRAVLFGIVFLVGIPVVHSVGQALYQYYSAVVGRKCAYEINQAVIGNILAQPMSFHDRHHSGELAAQATRDSLTFVLLFTRNIPETVSVLMISAVALALVFSMNPWLGVIIYSISIRPDRPARRRRKGAEEREKLVRDIQQKWCLRAGGFRG